MSHDLARLIIPAALGVVGFLGNMLWVQRQVAPASYVGIAQDVPAGARIPPSALEVVTLPGRDALRNRDLVPWSDRGLIENTVALRPLRVGFLVLLSDVVEDRQPPHGFDLIYVDLERVTFRPDRLLPGTFVAFLVRLAADSGPEEDPRLGPFEVFEPPVLAVEDLDQAERGRARVSRALSVLIPADDPDGRGAGLRRAVSAGRLQAIEVVAREE